MASLHLYGGSRHLITGLFERLGFPVRLVDTGDLDLVNHELGAGDVGIFLFEPVSNPLILVADVPALIEAGHRHRVTVIVDKTFASAYLLCPARFDADIVVESATKYMGGHGDVMAGIVATDFDMATVARDVRTASGAVLGPFEAWLVLRGLRTLALRVRRHCDAWSRTSRGPRRR